MNKLSAIKIVPNAETQKKLQDIGTKVLLKPITLKELLRRTEVRSQHLSEFGIEEDLDTAISEPVEILIKYEGYIKKRIRAY